MKKSESKTMTFFRRNAVYFILAFCVLAVGLSLAFILLNKDSETAKIDSPDPSAKVEAPIDETPAPVVKNPSEDVYEPVINPVPEVEEIVFTLPVENATSISEYSEAMVFNSVLKRFTAHLAVDFFAEEGTPVYAVYGGTVEKVENTLIYGITVTIDHGDGLKTVYNSLAEDVDVVAGQSVAQGEKIGAVSVTNRQEYKEGAHLHFEVLENGESVDPTKYMTFDEK